MDVYGGEISIKPLTNIELIEFAQKLDLPLRGVYARDTLPSTPLPNECGIVNFNKIDEGGSHWTCWWK